MRVAAGSNGARGAASAAAGARGTAAAAAGARSVSPKVEEPAGTGSAEWAVWIATGVLVAGAYARHGLLVLQPDSNLHMPRLLSSPPHTPRLRPARQISTLYWLSTAVLCLVDPSLHSLQLLNLAAVVFDLSFELQRLYLLVSNRPLLMVVILGVALGVEWLLERYEEEDNAATGSQRGGFARIGRSVGRVLLPGVMGVLIACVGWLLLSAVLLHPTALVTPVIQYVERRVGGSSACASISDCLLITGSTFQVRWPIRPPPCSRAAPACRARAACCSLPPSLPPAALPAACRPPCSLPPARDAPRRGRC